MPAYEKQTHCRFRFGLGGNQCPAGVGSADAGRKLPIFRRLRQCPLRHQNQDGSPHPHLRRHGSHDLRSQTFAKFFFHLKSCSCLGFALAFLFLIDKVFGAAAFLLKFNAVFNVLIFKQNSEELVEQSIREAIKMAWWHGSRKAWDWYFSYDGRPATNKPTNREFISRIAYILEIWQECNIIKGGL